MARLDVPGWRPVSIAVGSSFCQKWRPVSGWRYIFRQDPLLARDRLDAWLMTQFESHDPTSFPTSTPRWTSFGDTSTTTIGCIHQTSVAPYSAQTVRRALSKRTNSKPIAEKLRPAKILLMLAPLPQPQLGKTNPMDKGRGEGQKLLLDLTCCADQLC